MKSKNIVISFLQVISAFAVMTLHSNNVFWTGFTTTEKYWRSANIIESLMYFAVPLFFMITGITLIDYQNKYSSRTYFIKRFEKTVIPYLFFSLFGAAYLYITGQINAITPGYLLSGLLSGKIIDIYWFFPTLFVIYFTIPLFSAVEATKKKNTFIYLLILGLVINVAFPFTLDLLGLDMGRSFSFAVISGYIFWPVLGYVLYNYKPTGFSKYLLIALSLVALILHIVGTRKLSFEAGYIVQTFKGYNNLPSVLYAIGVFIILSSIASALAGNIIFEKIIGFLANYTFAFYLLHWFVMDQLKRLPFVDIRSILWRMGAPYITALIIICITYIIRKIPVLRKVLP